MAPDPANIVAARPKAAEWTGNRERGSTGLLKFMAFLSLRLGRTLSRAALYGIAIYFFLFAPGARRQSRRYLRRALGRAPRARDRFRHVLNFATTIHDRVYLINEQFDTFRITIEGESLMREQVDLGRGAFLIGAHMGSFEVIGSLGRRETGIQVSMAMYEDNARKINTILAAINPKAKPDIVSLGHIDAMLRIAERLDRGAFVGMLGDRTLGDEPVHEVTILGERAYLPTGPLRAAAIRLRTSPALHRSPAMPRWASQSSVTRLCSINTAAAIPTIGSISSTSGARRSPSPPHDGAHGRDVPLDAGGRRRARRIRRLG
jgi:predicted LPLAT superfamily acyltransferase